MAVETQQAERRERRRAVVRDEVVDTAWRLATVGGIAAVTLKNVADEMGIKAPSLYEYVPNLHGLFDLMFRSGWQALQREVEALTDQGAGPHDWFARLLAFCVEEPARFELMLQRPVPGFTPSVESMAVSQATYDLMVAALGRFGITRQSDVDLADSLLLGLAGNQIANDPGGTRFQALGNEAVDLLLRTATRKAR